MGERCRYDGESKPSDAVDQVAARWREAGGSVVAVCPEQLGGLSTPRPPADLRGGDGHAVLDGRATVRRLADDEEVTAAFVQGARLALERAPRAQVAVLKARSPSCGVSRTEIEGRLQPGDGVFAALLRRRGVVLRSDEDL